eukprot:Sspe_Gene.56830::Locus_31243_Transcript_1_1_Confidence_1.000_Length_9627::g.56830::m.56830
MGSALGEPPPPPPPPCPPRRRAPSPNLAVGLHNIQRCCELQLYVLSTIIEYLSIQSAQDRQTDATLRTLYSSASSSGSPKSNVTLQGTRATMSGKVESAVDVLVTLGLHKLLYSNLFYFYAFESRADKCGESNLRLRWDTGESDEGDQPVSDLRSPEILGSHGGEKGISPDAIPGESVVEATIWQTTKYITRFIASQLPREPRTDLQEMLRLLRDWPNSCEVVLDVATTLLVMAQATPITGFESFSLASVLDAHTDLARELLTTLACTFQVHHSTTELIKATMYHERRTKGDGERQRQGSDPPLTPLRELPPGVVMADYERFCAARNMLLNVIDEVLSINVVQRIALESSLSSDTILDVIFTCLQSRSLRGYGKLQVGRLLLHAGYGSEKEELGRMLRPVVHELFNMLQNPGSVETRTPAHDQLVIELLDLLCEVLRALEIEERKILLCPEMQDGKDASASGEGSKISGILWGKERPEQVRSRASSSTRSSEARRRRKVLQAVPTDCYVKLVTCLSSREGSELAPSICMSVLDTIGALLQGNNRAREQFRNDITWPTVGKAMLHCFDDRPPMVLFQKLFNILVEGDFGEGRKVTIQNEDVISVILNDLCFHPSFMNTESLLHVAKRIRRVLSESTHNLARACSVNIMEYLVTLLVRSDDVKVREQVCQCIEKVGKHNITVKQLKSILSSLKDQSPQKRTGLIPWIIRLLRNLVRKEQPSKEKDTMVPPQPPPPCNAPPNFFDFNAVHSGLRLPAVNGYPSTNGYSISMWLRIESYEPPFLQVPASITSPSSLSRRSRSTTVKGSQSARSRSNSEDGVAITPAIPLMGQAPPQSPLVDGLSMGTALADRGKPLKQQETRKDGSRNEAIKYLRRRSVSNAGMPLTPTPETPEADIPPLSPSVYKPRVYSFANSAGHVFEAYLCKGHMHLVVRVPGEGEADVEIDTFQFVEKRWYHILITHTCGKRLIGRSEAKLYVDGIERWRDSLRFPRPVGAMSACVGTDLAGLRHETLLTSLYGQISCIYFFEGAQSSVVANALYELGPAYQSNFAPADREKLASSLHSDQVKVLLGEFLTSKIFMLFNPLASHDGCLVNIAGLGQMDEIGGNVSPSLSQSGSGPAFAGQQGRGSLDGEVKGNDGGLAHVLKGTRLCITQQLHQVLESVGGMHVLVPLLALLGNDPGHVSALLDEGAGQAAQRCEITPSLIPFLVTHLFALLSDLVKQNQRFVEEIQQSRIFLIINMLLAPLGPHLNEDNVDRISLLLARVVSNEDAWRDGVLYLLMDLNIWIQTTASVQVDLFQTLRKVALNDNDEIRRRVRNMRILHILLEHLAWFLYYSPEDSQGSSSPVSPHKEKDRLPPGRVRGLKGNDDVRKVRMEALDLLAVLMADCSSDDVAVFLNSLTNPLQDTGQIVDLVDLLVSLIEQRGAAMLEPFLAHSGIDLLIPLLARPSPALAQSILRCFGVSVVLNKQLTTRMKSHCGMATIQAALLPHPFDFQTYKVLRDVTLGTVHKPLSGSWQATQRQVKPLSEEGWACHSIDVPAALVVIWKLALWAPLELKRLISDDLLVLLGQKQSDAAACCTAILELDGWYRSLLDLLGRLQEDGADDPHGAMQVCDNLLDVMATVVYHALKHLDHGWMQLDAIVAAVLEYSTSLDHYEVTQALYQRLVKFYLSDTANNTFPCDRSPAQNNIIYVILFIEEHLCYHETVSAAMGCTDGSLSATHTETQLHEGIISDEESEEKAEVVAELIFPASPQSTTEDTVEKKKPRPAPLTDLASPMASPSAQPSHVYSDMLAVAVDSVITGRSRNTSMILSPCKEPLPEMSFQASVSDMPTTPLMPFAPRGGVGFNSTITSNVLNATGSSTDPVHNFARTHVYKESHELRRDPTGGWRSWQLAADTLEILCILHLYKVQEITSSRIDTPFEYTTLSGERRTATYLSRPGGLNRICFRLLRLCLSEDPSPDTFVSAIERTMKSRATAEVGYKRAVTRLFENAKMLLCFDKMRDQVGDLHNSGKPGKTCQESRPRTLLVVHALSDFLLRSRRKPVHDEELEKIALHTLRWVFHERRHILDPDEGSPRRNMLSPRDSKTPWLQWMCNPVPSSQITSDCLKHFDSIVQSPGWHRIVHAVVPALESRQREAGEMWFEIVSRRQSTAVRQVAFVRRLEEERAKAEQEKYLRTAKATADMQTISSVPLLPMQQMLFETARTAEKYWRYLLQAVTNERGAWSMRPSRIFVCRSRREVGNIEHTRIRLKLCRDPKGTDHAGITQRQNKDTDVTPHPTAADVKKGTESDDEEERDDKDFYDVEDDLVEESAPPGTVLHSEKCEIIALMQGWSATIQIYHQPYRNIWLHVDDENTCIVQAMNPACESLVDRPKDDQIAIDSIEYLVWRRHRLRWTAIEFFFTDAKSLLLNFPSKESALKIFRVLVRMKPRPKNLKTRDVPKRAPPLYDFEKSSLQQKWLRREISNFEYLMGLNFYASRTCNDLTQYPVFPWVLCDYTSSEINLDDPKVYRDLSHPMGCIGTDGKFSKDRAQELEMKYQSLECIGMEPYHCGSHYSNSGFTLFYLIRLEPYTTGGIILQGSKFDHADRMFDSLHQTWYGVTHSAADVKELIPEFFYLPEIFINNNNVNFGMRQDGRRLGDVELPPWASSPHDFVRIHREALESEYVTAHLHEWIDLIFGYKQHGAEAKASINTFHPYSYEQNMKKMDLNKLDEHVRLAIISHIDNFGQTPVQLFSRPHPKRSPPPATFYPFKHLPGALQPQNTVHRIIPGKPIVKLYFAGAERMVAIGGSGVVSIHNFRASGAQLNRERTLTPLAAPLEAAASLALAATRDKGSSSAIRRERRKAYTFEAASSFKSRAIQAGMKKIIATEYSYAFAALPDRELLFSSGLWNHSATISELVADNTNPLVLQSLFGHKDTVTCLALAEDYSHLVTGSRDTTLILWSLRLKGSGYPLAVLKATLYGHDDEVLCVAISPEVDLVASGSSDGTAILYSVSDGRYERTLSHPTQGTIDLIAINSINGNVVFFSRFDLKIYLFSINGRRLHVVEAGVKLHTIFFTKDCRFLICGGSGRNANYTLTVRWGHDLSVVHKYGGAPCSVRSVAMHKEGQIMAVGLEDGSVLFYSLAM